MKKLASLALPLVLSLLYVSVARADGDGKDFDEDSEGRSAFWERAIHPNKQLYANRIKRAQRYLNRSDKQSRERAERLLRDAIKLQPDAPLAYWYLGVLHLRNENWKKCAAVHGRMIETYPQFKPPVDRRNPRSLDMSVGTCDALAGNYEEAIRHFKRILARGDTNLYEVHWRLGETYMALGRLKDAIASLKNALRLRSDHMVRFALAAAYDRNEQLALAREQLKSATMSSYTANKQVIPAEDRIYYRAIKAQYQGDARKAVLYFREYLLRAKRSQWRRRAEHHLKSLKIKKLTVSDLDLDGTAKLDLKLLATRINKAQSAFQTCLSPAPGLLISVRLVTKKVPGTAKTRRRYYRRTYGHYRYRRRHGYYRPRAYYRTFPPGATANILHRFGVEEAAAWAAVQCVQTVASKIKLPRVTGSPGSWRKIVFSVIKLPSR